MSNHKEEEKEKDHHKMMLENLKKIHYFNTIIYSYFGFISNYPNLIWI